MITTSFLFLLGTCSQNLESDSGVIVAGKVAHQQRMALSAAGASSQARSRRGRSILTRESTSAMPVRAIPAPLWFVAALVPMCGKAKAAKIGT